MTQIVDLKLGFSEFQFLDDESTLSKRLGYLLSGSHHLLPKAESVLNSIDNDLSQILNSAFVDKNPLALLDIHKTLYQIYEVSLNNPLSSQCSQERSLWLFEIRNKIEVIWLNYEFQCIKNELPNSLELECPEFIYDWFIYQSKKESVLDGLLLDFLKNYASFDQFNLFFLSDAPLNYRFCDALALAQIYPSEATQVLETVKAEIARNMWDEQGHGLTEKSHTRQFTRMLTMLGLQKPLAPIWEDWRPYAGYNLHFCFGLNRKHYFKGIGSLAMPELFDPNRNRAVVYGLERLYSDAKIRCEYFYTHIEGDEDHGAGWLKNVIIPIVKAQPETGIELAIGGALRMEAMMRYNSYLASQFGLLTP
jgi:hypothetical protein